MEMLETKCLGIATTEEPESLNDTREQSSPSLPPEFTMMWASELDTFIVS